MFGQAFQLINDVIHKIRYTNFPLASTVYLKRLHAYTILFIAHTFKMTTVEEAKVVVDRLVTILQV